MLCVCTTSTLFRSCDICEKHEHSVWIHEQLRCQPKEDEAKSAMNVSIIAVEVARTPREDNVDTDSTQEITSGGITVKSSDDGPLSDISVNVDRHTSANLPTRF